MLLPGVTVLLTASSLFPFLTARKDGYGLRAVQEDAAEQPLLGEGLWLLRVFASPLCLIAVRDSLLLFALRLASAYTAYCIDFTGVGASRSYPYEGRE